MHQPAASKCDIYAWRTAFELLNTELYLDHFTTGKAKYPEYSSSLLQEDSIWLQLQINLFK